MTVTNEYDRNRDGMSLECVTWFPYTGCVHVSPNIVYIDIQYEWVVRIDQFKVWNKHIQ